MSRGIFEHLFLLARPAAGKSELIDFLKKLPAAERAQRFHVGEMAEVDDFPWLWEACEEDDRRAARGEARQVSERTREGYNITKPKFRGSLIPRFNQTIRQRYLSNRAFYEAGTVLIEFARGRADGFRDSLAAFDPEILRRSAILYVRVSFEESFRRNNARYKPGQEESILFHKVPDADMLGFFQENDWDDLAAGRSSGRLSVGGVEVPFAELPNEPESTDPAVLGPRYETALSTLWRLRASR